MHTDEIYCSLTLSLPSFHTAYVFVLRAGHIIYDDKLKKKIYKKLVVNSSNYVLNVFQMACKKKTFSSYQFISNKMLCCSHALRFTLYKIVILSNGMEINHQNLFQKHQSNKKKSDNSNLSEQEKLSI